MNFSEELGFAPAKEIQVTDLDAKTRNRLFNIFHSSVEMTGQSGYIYEYLSDKLGYVIGFGDSDKVKKRFLNQTDDSNWYDAYDIITYFFELIIHMNEYQFLEYYGRAPFNTKNSFLENVEKQINQVLEGEKSGYRMVKYRLVAITGEEEIQSIKDSLSNPFGAVSTHMQKALELYSDRDNPDYVNSIKESISAVESMCCVITGAKGKQATLGQTIKKLEENGVTIHPSQQKAFSELYGFTNDAGGIRHGKKEYTNILSEDALYMLVTCSAFINYLKVKYEPLLSGTGAENNADA